jgi:hypothetical protein
MIRLRQEDTRESADIVARCFLSIHGCFNSILPCARMQFCEVHSRRKPRCVVTVGTFYWHFRTSLLGHPYFTNGLLLMGFPQQDYTLRLLSVPNVLVQLWYPWLPQHEYLSAVTLIQFLTLFDRSILLVIFVHVLYIFLVFRLFLKIFLNTFCP